jgi:tetratricopeptide (TPR) repeat protein
LFPPQALLRRLTPRLPLLTSSVRDVPARQQNLRNTIKWSYDLLTTDEQRLFRLLSVFVGGCTLEAAESVSAALGDTMPPVLDRVASLIDKNLLLQPAQEGADPRLRMLETIREFGVEGLSTSGEREAARQAHAAYYVQLAEEAEPALKGPHQAAWLERLERELDNLRAALSWLLERGQEGERIEMALRLGASLWYFWKFRSHVQEGVTVLVRALERAEGSAPSVRAKALLTTGEMSAWLGDFERGEALCQQSLALRRESGDVAGVGFALLEIGAIEQWKGNMAAARSWLEASLAPSTEVGDKHVMAWSHYILHLVDSSQGQYLKGRSQAEASLLLFRELGDTTGIAHALRGLAERFLDEGDAEQAHPLLEESLALFREVGSKDIEGWVLGDLGIAAFQQGKMAVAHALLQEGLTYLQEENGFNILDRKVWMLAHLAQVVAFEGDDATARVLYEQCLAIARKLPLPQLRPFYLEGLAGVVAAQGELLWAAQLWGTAEAIREATETPLPPVYRAEYERSVAAARTQLEEQAFAAAWARGRGMTLEQVLAARG